MRANQPTMYWKTSAGSVSIRSGKLGSNTKQMKTKNILCNARQSLKKSTMKSVVSNWNHVTRSLLAFKQIKKMKKKHNSKVRHAYLLPLLQIPVFQNYLMINVSCARKEGSNATTKRDSQLQLQLMKLLSPFLLLPKQKTYQCTKSSCWTYTWKNLNRTNIVIVISLFRNKQVMEPKVSRCIPLNTPDEKL